MEEGIMKMTFAREGGRELGGGGREGEVGGGGGGEESTGYWIAAFGTLLQPFPLGFLFCHTPTQPRFIMGDRKQPSDIF